MLWYGGPYHTHILKPKLVVPSAQHSPNLYLLCHRKQATKIVVGY